VSRRYSIADARISLPAIVDQAEAGERVELTRRGKPVAVVVSLREFERLRGDRSRFRDAYKKFLDQYSLEEIGLDDDFAAVARDKRAGRKVAL
jgi:prevent-host-death family protein